MFKALLQLANFTLGPDATLNTEIHKNSVRIKTNHSYLSTIDGMNKTSLKCNKDKQRKESTKHYLCFPIFRINVIRYICIPSNTHTQTNHKSIWQRSFLFQFKINLWFADCFNVNFCWAEPRENSPAADANCMQPQRAFMFRKLNELYRTLFCLISRVTKTYTLCYSTSLHFTHSRAKWTISNCRSAQSHSTGARIKPTLKFTIQAYTVKPPGTQIYLLKHKLWTVSPFPSNSNHS